MADSAVQRFYRFHAHVYDGTRWTILHGRRRAAEKLALSRDASVLEVGCGTGLNFRYVQKHLDPQHGRLVGLDFSHDMLRIAERRVAGRDWHNVELIQGDATAMNLGRKFDGILFAYSITMIPNWPAAIDRAAEHLKPGGKLVVLDFSRFLGWGPLAPAMRTWLRLNHVDTRQPYEDKLRDVFPQTSVSYWMGGYNFTAVSTAGES